MIIYFSATGNCKYVASRIGEKTDDKICSMIELERNDKYVIDLKDDENFGIVIPTYFWQLPVLVEEYLSKIKINNSSYCYVVSTYGTTSGSSTRIVEKYLNGVDAKFNLRMPDTWTPTFDLSSDEKIDKFSKNTEKDLDTIIGRILNSEKGNFTNFELPIFISKIAKRFYESSRKTDHFNVEDSCISCGLCAGSCPVDAIELVDGKPVWVLDKCLVCLRCLHRCPKFSIQYSKNTKKHGQYTNPHINRFD